MFEISIPHIRRTTQAKDRRGPRRRREWLPHPSGCPPSSPVNPAWNKPVSPDLLWAIESHSICYTPNPPVPLQQTRPGGQHLAPITASPGADGAKFRFSARLQKVPQLQRLASVSRRKIKQRREIPPPLPGSLTHRSNRRRPLPWVLSALQPLPCGRRSSSLPRAASVCHSLLQRAEW